MSLGKSPHNRAYSRPMAKTCAKCAPKRSARLSRQARTTALKKAVKCPPGGCKKVAPKKVAPKKVAAKKVAPCRC